MHRRPLLQPAAFETRERGKWARMVQAGSLGVGWGARP